MYLLVLTLLIGCGAEHEGDGANECSDDADNDRDGLFDCADTDCAGSAACADTGIETGDSDTDADSDSDTDADTDTDFVLVQGSTFQMGCTPSQASQCMFDEPFHSETLHNVTLTHDYWVSVTEVTQEDFEAKMGYNPSYFSTCGPTCPVETVSWYESAAYANAMSRAAGLTECYACTGSLSSIRCEVAIDPYDCDGFRLLTEAEWEGAARCGTDLVYSGSDTILDVGWTSADTSRTTHAVAGLDANACGLYDMSGNVWEWTQDWYGTLSPSVATDPTGAPTGSNRVDRGGSWGYQASNSRVARRYERHPDEVFPDLGFQSFEVEPLTNRSFGPCPFECS